MHFGSILLIDVENSAVDHGVNGLLECLTRRYRGSLLGANAESTSPLPRIEFEIIVFGRLTL